MLAERFESLSKRQMECLRGVLAHKGSKQIAGELNIAASTVDSYIAEAIAHLGVRNRREAAVALGQYELASPGKSGAEKARVAPPEPPHPSPLQPVNAVPTRPTSKWWERLPIRRKEQVDNELRPAERLLWIPVIAICLAIGFGMLMSGLQIAAIFIDRFWRMFD